jgi:cytochrome c oxidase subunit II
MFKKKNLILIGLLLSVLMVISACGSDKTSDTEKDTSTEATTSTETSSETAATTDGSGVEIIATDFEFDKKEYVVKAGEEVTVKLTSKKGNHGIDIQGLNVSIKEANGSVTFTPEEPGEYKIICNVFCGTGHGEMTSTLVVQ